MNCKAFSLISLIFILCSAAPATAQVRFDADFEAGALGEVTLLDSVRVIVAPGDTVEHLSYLVGGSYDPLNPVDVDLEPSANWYFFRMTGIKGKQIYLTMRDNGVHRTSYSYDGEHWGHLPIEQSDRRRLDKRFDHDTVYIALYEPYTYTYLQQRLADWTKRADVVLDTIGWSHEGRPMQMLHITDPSVPQSEKALVWIHGRQHPSESPGSYLLDGLIDCLSDDTPEGAALRKGIDAYILPFANPDGVAHGLSRCNVTGVNQEINFGRSEDSTVVEVKAIKAMFEKLTAARPLDIMLNSHSQLADHATFWMHRASATTLSFQRKQWVFTGLTCSFNPYLKTTDMLFSAPAPRYAEGWCWDHAGEQTLAITIETPYCCYSNNMEGEWVTNDNLRYFGKRTLQAMAEYLGISLPGRYIIETPARMKSGWEPAGEELAYMGDNGWIAAKAGAAVTYSAENIPAGTYDLYRFVPGSNISPESSSSLWDRQSRQYMETGVHGWVKEGTVVQKRDGRFKNTLQAAAAGEVADAILLLKAE